MEGANPLGQKEEVDQPPEVPGGGNLHRADGTTSSVGQGRQTLTQADERPLPSKGLRERASAAWKWTKKHAKGMAIGAASAGGVLAGVGLAALLAKGAIVALAAIVGAAAAPIIPFVLLGVRRRSSPGCIDLWWN